MDHAGEPALGGPLLQQGDGILIGIPAMDDERQGREARRLDMPAEDLLLPLARAVLIEIIEARLADADHLGMHRQLHQPCRPRIGLALRLVGMDTDGAPDIAETLGDGPHPLELRQPGADGDQGSHPRPARAGHDLIELAGEGFEIEMAMAVDEHAGIARVVRQPASRRNAGRRRWAPARPCRREAPGPDSRSAARRARPRADPEACRRSRA